jgi:HEAT repeat protein
MRRLGFCTVGFLLLLSLAGLAGAADLRQQVTERVAQNDLEGIRSLGPAALPELARLYESGDARRKITIAWIFYQVGTPSKEAERVLLRDARTANSDLRVNVLYALGRVSNDQKVVDTLLDIMRHDDSAFFRDKAACALTYDQAHLTETQKVLLYEKLIDALSDPEPQVQAIANLSLKILTGQKKGFNHLAPPEQKQKSIEAWKRWLAEYRANL